MIDLNLNAEQRAAVCTREGYWLCLATAGSGKTAVLVERIRELILANTPLSEILALTFTTEAANNMSTRIGMGESKNERGGFRTFHSFGLKLILAERVHLPFRLADNPFASGNGSRILREVIKARFGRRLPKRENDELRTFISKMKRQQVELPDSFERDIIPAAEVHKWGSLAAEYVRRMRQEGQLDYDDMIVEAVALLENDSVRARWQFKWVHCDEAQDTDNLQFRMLQLVSEKHKNVFVVGDANQCQPPDTIVETLAGPKRIADLSSDDRIISWTRTDQRTYNTIGRKVKITNREYTGKMLTINTRDFETRMTPNHWVWAKLNDNAVGRRIVYLMWRKGYGFRVGTSWLKNRHRTAMFTHRFRVEKADKLWILGTFDTRQQAEIEEQITSFVYSIPYSTYEPPVMSDVPRTRKQIKDLFLNAFEDDGFRCLEHHGLLFEQPFLERGKTYNFRGYFKTAAANLLRVFMDLPTMGVNKNQTIARKVSEDYKGIVYSLDVTKDHTYVADGLVVGNSMYAFRGARPDNLQKFTEWFPGAQTLILPENYRSTKAIVSFSQQLAPIKNELTENMRTANEQGVDVQVTNFLGNDDEVDHVLETIQTLPGRSAILARTNQQIGLFETVCTANDIKFHLLGKTGYWRTPEVKNLMGLVQFVLGTEPAGDHYPSKLVQPLRGKVHMLPAPDAVKAVIDRANLRELYADEEYDEVDNFALGNLNAAVMIAQRFKNLREFSEFANRASHASRKSKKAITLGTIHSAKGLEWDNVFVVGCTDGRVPHEKGDLHEERCIFYVAVSRPAKQLFISYSGQRSRFLDELDEELEDGLNEVDG